MPGINNTCVNGNVYFTNNIQSKLYAGLVVITLISLQLVCEKVQQNKFSEIKTSSTRHPLNHFSTPMFFKQM